LTFSKREFSRLRTLDFKSREISTDCMGFIYLLMQQQDVLPSSVTQKSKVADLFDYALGQSFKRNIGDLRPYDLLMWKKEAPGLNGDTGHVLLLMGQPVQTAPLTYKVLIAEVSKFASGPCKREITLLTDERGDLLSVHWHPKKTKVQPPYLIALKVFKRFECQRCHFPARDCLCQGLPSPLWDNPPFRVLQDSREKKVALRSTRILELCFNASLYEVPEEINPQDYLIVFPEREAKLVDHRDTFEELRGRKLLFLDGSWKQVKALLHHNPSLKEIPSIKFSRPKVAQYRIRKAPSSGHLSTLESFSFLWRKIYPENYCRAQRLELLFEEMIDRQISHMGSETYANNYSHYPGFKPVG